MQICNAVYSWTHIGWFLYKSTSSSTNIVREEVSDCNIYSQRIGIGLYIYFFILFLKFKNVWQLLWQSRCTILVLIFSIVYKWCFQSLKALIIALEQQEYTSLVESIPNLALQIIMTNGSAARNEISYLWIANIFEMIANPVNTDICTHNESWCNIYTYCD